MEQLDKSKVHLEDRYESSITVVGNLSILYGESGNVTECLMMCEKGIKVCLECGRGAKLVKFMVNKAEAMGTNINTITAAKSKKYLQQAYYISDLFSLHSISAYIDQYYRANYEQSIIWY